MERKRVSDVALVLTSFLCMSLLTYIAIDAKFRPADTPLLAYNSLASLSVGPRLPVAVDTTPGERCQINPEQRVECGYLGIEQDACVQRGCCWKPAALSDSKSHKTMPYCYKRLETEYSCSAAQSLREDCGWIGMSPEECVRRNCCWSPVHQAKPVPALGNHTGVGITQTAWCYSKVIACDKGYKLLPDSFNRTSRGLDALLTLNEPGCARYQDDVKILRLSVSYDTKSTLRVTLRDEEHDRYEVPESAIRRPAAESDGIFFGDADDVSGSDQQYFREESRDPKYRFDYSENPFTFSVTRIEKLENSPDTKETVIFSSLPSLVFEDSYLEISTSLPPDAHIYGLGETVDSFRRNPRDTWQTIWARDAATPVRQNLYGSHPFYMELRDGKMHGTFLMNSNGMDVVLSPERLTYKVIGGILDFYFFIGPRPQDVMREYTRLIGRPAMVSYWSLGFHMCRYGYKNIEEVDRVVENMKKHEIPLDTMWTDIDYMDAFKDFTLDPKNFPLPKVQALVDKLHANKQKYVMIIDPGIKIEKGYAPYDDGIQGDIFIKNKHGNNLIGRVWPGKVHFPDFFYNNTNIWWTHHINEFMKLVHLDGIWIDMNEAASWCEGECISHMKATETGERQQNIGDMKRSYKINNAGMRASLETGTVSVDVVHANGLREYDVHNLYGHMESIATRDALLKINKGKRPFILTRSTFAGTGAYAGHWLGDNWSTWDHLYYSITGILSFQLFAIPYVGADICGFNGAVTEELCLRWMQLGALYPFSRNHNAIYETGQEPYVWPSVAAASKRALNERMALLPYFYTLMQRSSEDGNAVWRPLFWEFPNDPVSPRVDRQFLLGPALLASPVLDQGHHYVTAYFPKCAWYDFRTGDLTVNVTSINGETVILPSPLDGGDLPLHLRGGYILPTQTPHMTTYESRQNNRTLFVGLDWNGDAKGELYIDDGESIEINGQFTKLEFHVKGGCSLSVAGYAGFQDGTVFERIVVYGYGLHGPSSGGKIAGSPALSKGDQPPLEMGSIIQKNVQKGRLEIIGLELPTDVEFELRWCESNVG